MLLLSAAVLACGSGEAPAAGPAETRLRFIADDPQVALADEEVFSSIELFTWRPAGGCALLSPLEGSRDVELAGSRVPLVRRGKRVAFSVPAPAEVGAIDRLEVVLGNPRPDSVRTGHVSLEWTDAAGRFSAERSLLQTHGELLSGGQQSYALALRTHREPPTEGARLRFSVLPPVDQPVTLCAVRGVAQRLVESRLRALAASGLKIALASQYRNALPALPGEPLERRLELPRDAELRFGYGVQPGGRAPMRFRVSLAVGQESTELFADALAPDRFDAWNDAAVDLGPWAGEVVVLRLESTLEGKRGTDGGLALWANPEVVARP